jgi:hypothetical protein
MDVAVLVLTAALVFTTAVYAYFTWRMVDEMQKSRLQTLRPRLGLHIHPYSPLGGHVALRSLGPGVALDVGLTLNFEPSGETRPWRTPVFPPGEEAQFFFPKIEGNQLPGFQDLEKNGVIVNVHGSMRDISGHEHTIAERFDVAAWLEALGKENQVYDEPAADKIARELKKIRERLEKGGLVK